MLDALVNDASHDLLPRDFLYAAVSVAAFSSHECLRLFFLDVPATTVCQSRLWKSWSGYLANAVCRGRVRSSSLYVPEFAAPISFRASVCSPSSTALYDDATKQMTFSRCIAWTYRLQTPPARVHPDTSSPATDAQRNVPRRSETRCSLAHSRRPYTSERRDGVRDSLQACDALRARSGGYSGQRSSSFTSWRRLSLAHIQPQPS